MKFDTFHQRAKCTLYLSVAKRFELGRIWDKAGNNSFAVFSNIGTRPANTPPPCFAHI